MNKYLLDTCVLLWVLRGNIEKLNEFTRIIENDKNIIFVSIASYWEIMIKKSIGRIEIHDDLAIATEESGFIWLDIKLRHIDYIEKLPNLHKDPFDRLLISQAKVDNLKFLTDDEKLKGYMSI
jgi:PIN domain nuclease of toxin-antitoxin system